MNLHNWFRDTNSHTTGISCMISCLLFTPNAKNLWLSFKGSLWNGTYYIVNNCRIILNYSFFTCHEVEVHFIAIQKQFAVSKLVHFLAC